MIGHRICLVLKQKYYNIGNNQGLRPCINNEILDICSQLVFGCTTESTRRFKSHTSPLHVVVTHYTAIMILRHRIVGFKGDSYRKEVR